MGLDIVEFVMSVEEEFAIHIPDREAEKIRTPRMLIDYVHRHAIDPHKAGCLSQRAFYAVRRELCARLELPRASLRPDTDLLAVLPRENTNAARTWVEVGAAIGCQWWPSIRGDSWFARNFQFRRPRTLGDVAKYVVRFMPTTLKRPGEEWAWEEVRQAVDRLIREFLAIRDYSLDDDFIRDWGLD